MKKYLPIRIFSQHFGYGWWWGSYFFFFGKHSTSFAIIPMYWHHYHCTYKNGNGIKDGTILSWSDERQREKQEDAYKNKKRGLWLSNIVNKQCQ